ncbi:MAG TPA: hypothetical protein DIC30_01365 [Oceanospirillales bacterium]|nr:hypothetical protein [Oleispira sp.]HCM04635.1 hypothetical protein [Oceanospirillales bacterium]|tara:strand:+ start:55 stop:900 length:846 start_codon:yes stop_codon:yes gene_type:complete
MQNYPVSGAGLGLRRALLGPLSSVTSDDINFMEVAPENWIGVGGRLGKQFRSYTERFDFMCHGLSLSIGSPDKLDVAFVKQVRDFMREHGIKAYSEHLSYCSSEGHMYDLMPIPFTYEAVRYVADRIRIVQDIIEQPLIIENVSSYAEPGKEMEEIDFLKAVIDESDCRLLLDVNNVFVNSTNHGFDAKAYLDQVPTDKISYMHIAGHYEEASDLLVDTHGASVKQDVWDLLAYTYQQHGSIPTLLERDFNFTSAPELLSEVKQIKFLQAQQVIAQGRKYA